MEEKMVGFVDGINWVNCEAMKYWSYPSGYAKDKKAEIRNYIFSEQRNLRKRRKPCDDQGLYR